MTPSVALRASISVNWQSELMDGASNFLSWTWPDALSVAGPSEASSPDSLSNFVPLPLLIIWVLCAVLFILNDTIWSPNARLLDKGSGVKFRVGDSPELSARKKFVADARKEVNDMKDKMGFVRLPTNDPDASPRRVSCCEISSERCR